MRDAKLVLSDAQAIAQNAGAGEQSDNVIDLNSGGSKNALGTARVADPWSPGLGVEFLITTTLVGASAVLTWSIYEHTAATSINSGNLIASLPTITIGTDTVTAGTKFFLPIPLDKINERYMGTYYAVATQNLTAGNVDAHVTNGPEKYFP